MKTVVNKIGAAIGAATVTLGWAVEAYCQATPPAAAPPAAPPAPEAPKLDTGDTAWMLTSTALVLMMTIPGLALFYGGMVRKKNVLATAMQSFAITCLVTILWMVVAYSIAFTGEGKYIGDFTRILLSGMGTDAVHSLAKTIPESVFMTFQMTFAIITPALIAGAFAERMKFSAMLLFIALWLIVVYAPIAHWVWGGGWLGGLGVLDFAGGTVVHINAGVAGLVCALVLGKRKGFGHDNMAPHNLIYSLIGASLLWVGWFGFNAGSAVSAGTSAGMAMAVTQIATAAAALAWMFAEWATKGKPSVLGIISGAVAGLVAITPASGFVLPGAAWVEKDALYTNDQGMVQAASRAIASKKATARSSATGSRASTSTSRPTACPAVITPGPRGASLPGFAWRTSGRVAAFFRTNTRSRRPRKTATS